MFATQCKNLVIWLFLEECDAASIPTTMRYLFAIDQSEDVRGNNLLSARFFEWLKQHVPPTGNGHNVSDRPKPYVPPVLGAFVETNSPDELRNKLGFFAIPLGKVNLKI